MKKISLLFISIIISSIIFSWVYAIDLEKKLYKDTILSANKIELEYKNWKDLNKKIEKIFIKYRYEKNIKTVLNLQNILKQQILKINSKSNLTRNDKKVLNLYNNIYYRTILLLDYQLKNVSSDLINNNSWFKIQTFDVDGSQFTFTEPTTKSTFTTSTDFITIKWKVLIEWISKVTVNDYILNSFDGSTWRYHASYNNNMIIWTNLYEIKYIDSVWKIVHKNTFTIIKKD